MTKSPSSALLVFAALLAVGGACVGGEKKKSLSKAESQDASEATLHLGHNWLSFDPAPLALAEYPNPMTHPEMCGLSRAGYLCDPNRKLRPSQRDSVQTALNALREKARDAHCGGKGYEMAVALTDQMDAPASEAKEDAAKRYATTLHDRWGVGDKDCKNGVLLFMAIGDRKVSMTTGPGVNKILSDRATLILESASFKAKLRRGDHAEALVQVVEEVAAVLKEGKEDEGLTGSERLSRALEFFCWFAWECLTSVGFWVFTSLLLYCWWNSYLSRRQRQQSVAAVPAARPQLLRCQQLVRNLEQHRLDAAIDRYKAQDCPICLERFLHRDAVARIPCGHKFHRRCLKSWHDRSVSCPICRRSVVSGTEQSTEEAAAAEEGALLTAAGNLAQRDMWELEYQFRIHRMRYFYSDLISDTMVHIWLTPGHTTRPCNDPIFNAPIDAHNGMTLSDFFANNSPGDFFANNSIGDFFANNSSVGGGFGGGGGTCGGGGAGGGFGGGSCRGGGVAVSGW